MAKVQKEDTYGYYDAGHGSLVRVQIKAGSTPADHLALDGSKEHKALEDYVSPATEAQKQHEKNTRGVRKAQAAGKVDNDLAKEIAKAAG